MSSSGKEIPSKQGIEPNSGKLSQTEMRTRELQHVLELSTPGSPARIEAERIIKEMDRGEFLTFEEVFPDLFDGKRRSP